MTTNPARSRLSPYSYAVRVLSGSRPEVVENAPTRYIPVPKSDSVGLYWANQDSWEQPFKSLPRAEVHVLKAQKKGKFINHGREFRLLAADPCRVIPNALQPTKEDMGKRDGLGRESCVMAEMTIFHFTLGIPRAVAVVNAWA